MQVASAGRSCRSPACSLPAPGSPASTHPGEPGSAQRFTRLTRRGRPFWGWFVLVFVPARLETVLGPVSPPARATAHLQPGLALRSQTSVCFFWLYSHDPPCLCLWLIVLCPPGLRLTQPMCLAPDWPVKLVLPATSPPCRACPSPPAPPALPSQETPHTGTLGLQERRDAALEKGGRPPQLVSMGAPWDGAALPGTLLPSRAPQQAPLLQHKHAHAEGGAMISSPGFV